MDVKLNQLRSTKLSDIRSKLSKECYRQSLPAIFSYLIFDLCWYILSIAVIFMSDHVLVQLLGGLSAGLATSALFIWGHDAAHGSLFKNQKLAEVLGTFAMLPSFNIYRMWCYGHNKVHHGFTSLTQMDWIWRPWSPKEYLSQTRFRRWVYRCERAMLTCALHYILRVWWEKMIRFKVPQKKLEFMLAKSFVLIALIAYFSLFYYAKHSLWATACAIVLPFIVFNYMIAFFVYLHHTHPEIPFFNKRDEWSFGVGGIRCSTIIRTSKLWEFLTHNILIHTPHHVDFRVPFYRLKTAYKDLKNHYGEFITEYRFSWIKVMKIFKQCKLYDYETKQWCDYNGNPIQA